jgi:hypothetical protein
MRDHLTLCVGVCPAELGATWVPATGVTENLVTDDGMEQWEATGPQEGWWNRAPVEWGAAHFVRDGKERMLSPSIADQLLDTKVLRPSTRDAHSGQKALRLRGRLYLRPTSQGAYKTGDGDIDLVRCRVNSEGQSLRRTTVYGDAGAVVLETKGKPEKERERERWSVIEERIEVADRAHIASASPRSSQAMRRM